MKAEINNKDHDGYFYYRLSFWYDGPTSFMPDSSTDEGVQAQAANIAADRRVTYLARKAGLEMIHAYAWPDGSLFKTVRTEKEGMARRNAHVEFDHQESSGGTFEAIFSDSKPKEVKLSKRRVKILVRLRDVYPVDPYEVSSVNLVNIKDSFERTREEMIELFKCRHAEDNRFFRHYYDTRDGCEACKPGGLACDSCSKLLEAARRNRDEWMKALGRPPVVAV